MVTTNCILFGEWRFWTWRKRDLDVIIWLHIIESGQLFSLLSFNVLPVPKQSGPKSEYGVNQSRSGALLSLTKVTGGFNKSKSCTFVVDLGRSRKTKNEKDEKYLKSEWTQTGFWCVKNCGLSMYPGASIKGVQGGQLPPPPVLGSYWRPWCYRDFFHRWFYI